MLCHPQPLSSSLSRTWQRSPTRACIQYGSFLQSPAVDSQPLLLTPRAQITAKQGAHGGGVRKNGGHPLFPSRGAVCSLQSGRARSCSRKACSLHQHHILTQRTRPSSHQRRRFHSESVKGEVKTQNHYDFL